MIELIATADEAPVTRREADIALRLTRPGPGTFVARRIATVNFGVYTRRGGEPNPPWVGFDETVGDRPEARWIERREGEPVVARAADLQTVFHAVRAGVGRGLLPSWLAKERHIPDGASSRRAAAGAGIMAAGRAPGTPDPARFADAWLGRGGRAGCFCTAPSLGIVGPLSKRNGHRKGVSLSVSVDVPPETAGFELWLRRRTPRPQNAPARMAPIKANAIKAAATFSFRARSTSGPPSLLEPQASTLQTSTPGGINVFPGPSAT